MGENAFLLHATNGRFERNIHDAATRVCARNCFIAIDTIQDR